MKTNKLFILTFLFLLVFALFDWQSVWSAVNPSGAVVVEPSSGFFRDSDKLGGWEYIDGNKVYTAYAERTYLGDNQYSMILYSAQEYVKEDNKLVNKENAKSLKGTDYYITRLTDDKIGDIEYMDYNWTDVIIKVMINNVPEAIALKGANIPIKLDGIQIQNVKFNDVEQLSDVIQIHSDTGMLNHNWSIGFNSTSDSFVSNNSADFEDNWLYTGNANDNFGASTGGIGTNRRTSGGVEAGIVRVNLGNLIGTGMTISNFTWNVKLVYVSGPDESLNMYSIACNEWVEGNGTGGAGNSSWNSPNNTFTAIDGSAVWTTGASGGLNDLKPECIGSHLADSTTGLSTVYYDFEFTTSEVQRLYNANNGRIDWMTNHTEIQSDNQLQFAPSESATPWAVYVDYTSNTAPSININSPDNDTITNEPNVEIVFNASDVDLNNLSCHLFEDTIPLQSIYTITQTVNQSLNTTLTIEQEHVFSVICDDGIANTTKYLTITYDTTNPTIEINNPYQNNTYYENDYYYNISINDTNLYSSNTTIYCNNIPYYENVTQDYNVSQIDLIDLISISTYGNNTCDICTRICDGHTGTQINLDYTFKNNELTINDKNEKILFTGDIKDIMINKLTDKLSYTINLNTKANVVIRLSKDFKKVSKTKYQGHFINLQKELWIDTNPFEISYYYYDKDYLYIIIIPQTTTLNFNSIGELNCITECKYFNIDTDYPYITSQSPLENDNYDTPINLSFTFIVTDSMNIANCSLYLNDTLNYTSEGITKGINQSMIIYFNTEPNNESYYYNITCSDYNAHLGSFENINFNINWLSTSVPPNETVINTYEAIDKFGKWIVTFILILIWALFLLISFILGGNWFILITGMLGIGIGVYHSFNGLEIMQFIFISFNLMIMAYAVMYHNNGILTK